MTFHNFDVDVVVAYDRMPSVSKKLATNAMPIANGVGFSAPGCFVGVR